VVDIHRRKMEFIFIGSDQNQLVSYVILDARSSYGPDLEAFKKMSDLL